MIINKLVLRAPRLTICAYGREISVVGAIRLFQICVSFKPSSSNEGSEAQIQHRERWTCKKALCLSLQAARMVCNPEYETLDIDWNAIKVRLTTGILSEAPLSTPAKIAGVWVTISSSQFNGRMANVVRWGPGWIMKEKKKRRENLAREKLK